MNLTLGLFVHTQAKLVQERILRMVKKQFTSPEHIHNIESLQVSRQKHFVSLKPE